MRKGPEELERRVFSFIQNDRGQSVAILALLACLSVGCDPFGGFDGKIEFANCPGLEAKRQLEHVWPPAVDVSAVQTVSYRRKWSIDSYSTWYRIRLSPDAAAKWSDHLHAEQARQAAQTRLGQDRDSLVEGVHRTIAGSPSLRYRTGGIPVWWSSPPEIEFRATEVMEWYADYRSRGPYATYSAFDKRTQTLWVYCYACQHARLWPPGEMPTGTPIDLAADQ